MRLRHAGIAKDLETNIGFKVLVLKKCVEG